MFEQHNILPEDEQGRSILQLSLKVEHSRWSETRPKIQQLASRRGDRRQAQKAVLFKPLAAEPQVAKQLAKGAEEKRQTQGDEEYGKCENENRRDAASFISLNRGPCCTA